MYSLISDLMVQLVHNLNKVLSEESAGGVVVGLGWILGKRLQIIMSYSHNVSEGGINPLRNHSCSTI